MLPVRGATNRLPLRVTTHSISIHAPRAGSDDLKEVVQQIVYLISIHAPRAGSDFHLDIIEVLYFNFNPCSPCGERRTAPCRGE